MNKAARVKSVRRGNRNYFVVKSGRAGTGKEIYICQYWPESPESERRAMAYCRKFAAQAGVDTLIFDNGDFDDQIFIMCECGKFIESVYFDRHFGECPHTKLGGAA